MRIDARAMSFGTAVTVEGRLDAGTTPQFEQHCAQLPDPGAPLVVLDFERLQYISSAGLRAILGLAKELNKHGARLALCGLSGMVAEVIHLAGLEEALPIYASLDEVEPA